MSTGPFPRVRPCWALTRASPCWPLGSRPAPSEGCDSRAEGGLVTASTEAVTQSVFLETEPHTGLGMAHGCAQGPGRGAARLAGTGPREEAMTDRTASQKRRGAHLRSEKVPAGSQAGLLSSLREASGRQCERRRKEARGQK